MKKFMVYHSFDGVSGEPEETVFEYDISEVISVNNNANLYKCFKKEYIEGNLFQHFKKGRLIYTYNY